MTRFASNHRLSCQSDSLFRIALVVVALLFAAFVVTPIPAQAASQPTLTVHATISATQTPSSGMSTLLPDGMYSAGPGYVFELERLDPDKVANAVPDGSTPEQRSQAILDHPANFLDPSASPIYGVTDESGTVTNKDALKGAWLSGATYDSATGTLSGGAPISFHGTIAHPEYFLIRLVFSPNKNVIFQSGVVQLPYMGKNGWIWDLVIYPKVNKPPVPVTPPNHPKTPPTNPPHKVVNPPQPSTVPNVPRIPGLPGELSNTGSNILYFLLAIVALLLIGLFISDIRNRHEQKHKHQMLVTTDSDLNVNSDKRKTMTMNEERSER